MAHRGWRQVSNVSNMLPGKKLRLTALQNQHCPGCQGVLTCLSEDFSLVFLFLQVAHDRLKAVFD
jgi:hypothetical protein